MTIPNTMGGMLTGNSKPLNEEKIGKKEQLTGISLQSLILFKPIDCLLIPEAPHTFKTTTSPQRC